MSDKEKIDKFISELKNDLRSRYNKNVAENAFKYEKDFHGRKSNVKIHLREINKGTKIIRKIKGKNTYGVKGLTKYNEIRSMIRNKIKNSNSIQEEHSHSETGVTLIVVSIK